MEESDNEAMEPYLGSSVSSSSPSSSSNSSNSSSSSSWCRQHSGRESVLKPFVDGGTIGFAAASANAFVPLAVLYLRNNPISQQQYIHITKMIPRFIFISTLAMSQTLGLFETLRRKAIATNDGMAPGLYQEATCGLAAGAAGAFARLPWYLSYQHPKAVDRIVSDQFRTLMRKGSGPYVRMRTSLEFGMLASYHPSLQYLRDSCGYSQSQSQCGASAISAVCATACSLPFRNANSLDSALKILTLRGPLGFFTGFSTLFFRSVAFDVMFIWYCLEEMKKFELSKGT